MSIIEVAVRLFAPHICIECGAEEDQLLCRDCTERLATVPPHCYRCQEATAAYQVCGQCAAHTPLDQVLVHARYAGVAKSLVRRLKFDRAQAGAREIASMMAVLLPCLPQDVVLVHIPTASGRVRSRGYDHARLLARALAARGGLRHQTLLGRIGQARQVGAGRAERLQQLEYAFRPLRPQSIQSRHVVLVDDVLTTGATLESAARVLLQAGAARVSAVVFAQA